MENTLELEELNQMSAGDLQVKERETREAIFRLRLKLRTGQLANPSGYRSARLELARILTLIRQKRTTDGTPDSAPREAR
jgi:ribosomal protein L29